MQKWYYVIHERGEMQMDEKRMLEGRVKIRFTYTVDEKLMQRVKIMAVKKKKKVNQILDELLIQEVEKFEAENGKEIL